jgi:hypothetical protein
MMKLKMENGKLKMGGLGKKLSILNFQLSIIFAFSIFNSQFSIALGAVTFDAVTTIGDSDGDDTISGTHSVGGGCVNPILIATITWKANPPQTISSVGATAGGMSAVGTQIMVGSDQHAVAMYYRVGTTGSQTVTVNFAGVIDLGTMAIRSYCGVDAGTPTGTAVTATGDFNATNPSVNVSSVAGDWVIDVVDLWGDPTATLTVGAGQTQRDNFYENRDSHVRADSDEVAAGTTTTMSWTKNVNNTWAMVGVALKASAGAPPAKRRMVVVVQ